MQNFIFFGGNQSMDADPAAIAREREDFLYEVFHYTSDESRMVAQMTFKPALRPCSAGSQK